MSSADAIPGAAESTRRSLWERLPRGLQPRRREPGPARWQRPLELALLIAVGLVLTIATLNDVVLQVGRDSRLSADVRTWRATTGHDYLNVSTENGEEDGHGTVDVTCANTSSGPPGGRIQQCLIMSGPVVHSVRRVQGGYYLPPYYQDKEAHRYGCYGSAVAEGLCLTVEELKEQLAQ